MSSSSNSNSIKRNFLRMFTDRPDWRRRTIDDHHSMISRKERVVPDTESSISKVCTLPSGSTLAQCYADYVNGEYKPNTDR